MHTVAVKNDTERSGPSVWKSVVLAVVVFAIGIAVIFPRAVVDLILPDQTVYVDGFSEANFARVKVGMTEREVLEIVGRPLTVAEYVGARVYESNWAQGRSAVVGAECRWWAYSKRGRFSDSYHVRAVKFSPDGKVLEVLHRYYAD